MQIFQCMQMSWNMDFTVDRVMLFSPCIICFLGFVFPPFFSPHVNGATAARCHLLGRMFPPCVRCNKQQVGHERQVAAVGNFWEPLADHRSRRSVKCHQGVEVQPRATLFLSCTKGDWLTCPKPPLGTSSPRQRLDDTCYKEKVMSCADLWSFKPEQRLPHV